jgi:hypothetical protein
MTDPTRREFLAAASVAPSVAGLCEAGFAQPADVPPDWLRGVTRMTFTGDVAAAATVGAQVAHTNLVWPYFPLRKDGGGLSKGDADKMKAMMATARKHGVRVGLGLPPFPSVKHVEAHPDWRVHPQPGELRLKPVEDNLGTRLGCNLGPWGDYLVELCGELVEDFGVDAFSFDGNYHPPVCYCPACKAAYRGEKNRDLPAKVNLDDVAYREYLEWRGDKLIDHYRKLRDRIRRANPAAAVMTWTVNAGRYGHFLHSPRAMPTKLNTVLDGAMQEWWLDETNFGGSVAPAFGAAYLRCVMGDKLAAAEPYLMSRGNPYGTDSFPAHERLTRTLLAVANGCVAAESLGWAGHKESAKASLDEVKRREPWIVNAEPLPWAAQLVSEQTRQFYAYKDIAERFLPHNLGAFRCSAEEHLVSTLVNDWDLTPAGLSKFAVLVLPNAAALSAQQVEAVREFVRNGGGLVASAETSLCDEIGRPRADFALADVFGLRYDGRPRAPLQRPDLDPNFAVGIDADYWKQRTGIATLTFADHAITSDERLRKLVPTKSVTFRGPLVKVAGVEGDCVVPVTMRPEGMKESLPAVVVRSFGKGKVVYLAAALDAALWSYAYPYQRVLLAAAIRWAARTPPPVGVTAPMCVQSTCFAQGKRTVVHLFNGVNTTANHGLPAADVPLREETLPVHGIVVTLRGEYASVRCEPGNQPVKVARADGVTRVELPPLELHAMVVAE